MSLDLDAYLHRIGYDGPRAPTLAVLRRLHELHPAAIRSRIWTRGSA